MRFLAGSSVNIPLINTTPQQRKVLFEAARLYSPRLASVDETNDCIVKSERGTLVRGSDPPY